MKKLPEDFKQKWIAALRSGEYKQGAGMLHNIRDNTYCCLGVACRVAGIDEYFVLDGKELIIDLAPDFRTNIPYILINGDMPDVLADMNDGSKSYNRKPKSFSEIADYIEANL